jgi:hypothetical protein
LIRITGMSETLFIQIMVIKLLVIRLLGLSG